MDALEQAAKYLAELQEADDDIEEKRRQFNTGMAKPITETRDLAQTYALVSIADSLHELTVQGLCVQAQEEKGQSLVHELNSTLEEIAHRLKERE